MHHILLRYILLSCVIFLNFGCEADNDPVVGCDGTLTLAITNTQPTTCGTDAGRLTVMAEGGVSPYTYQLNGGMFQNGNTFSGIPAGVNQLTVMDDAGCEVQIEATITTGLMLDAIKPVLETNCAIASCHNGDRGDLPNFTVDSIVVSRALQIQTRTGDRSMPPPGTATSLTDTEIMQISCWVDDGAP